MVATLGPELSKEQALRQKGVLTTWGERATPQKGHGLRPTPGPLAPVHCAPQAFRRDPSSPPPSG